MTARPKRIAPRVFFVGEHDHREERVGSQKIVSLFEERRIDTLERDAVMTARRCDADRVPRIGLDQKVVPALELRLEAASILLDARDERREVRRELRFVREPREKSRSGIGDVSFG